MPTPPTVTGAASARYLSAAHALLTRLEGQLGQIEAAADWLAESLSAGGSLFLAGTGHSRLVAEEAYHRAGGLVAVRPVYDPSSSLAHGADRATLIERLHDYGTAIIATSGLSATDLLVVISQSGRNAVPIDMALAGRRLGCQVVAITSLQHSTAAASRHRSGKRLFEVADLTIDNCVAHGDASVAVRGLPVPVGPLSTLAGVTIVNALSARAAELLAARGSPPALLSSDNAAQVR